MKSAEALLKKYWKFDGFRAPQQEIITAVLHQKDTIALLPTGGGKSVCFQIPALLQDGICLVISPLIALMQDQVQQLKAKGIKASLIASGASQDQIVTLFDNLKFGNYKFLYLSPERLQSSFIQQKLTELSINLIAIDEAHCISEWGHDFRPSYRNISLLKTLLPTVPFIALTASASQKVVADITKNLSLITPAIFKKSLARENLAYQIFTVEDKLTRLLQIFTKTKKPAIVYVNSRKKTKDIANFLTANHFKSSFYHGKLAAEEKEKAFENWISERTPIMVATNAFGMGIDKANVGIVIHLDLPSSIENYVQEAGRAGRNNDKSFAVLLQNANDIRLFKHQLAKNYPSILEVKKVYQQLFQHLQIAKGEFCEEGFDFNLLEFCEKYHFQTAKTATILQLLCNYEILDVARNYDKKSTVIFKASNKQLLHYGKNNSTLQQFLQVFLRTYAGVFEQETRIDEFLLAKKSGMTSLRVIQFLTQLSTDEIAVYHQNNAPATLRFLHPREDDKTINRISKNLATYIHQKITKGKQLIAFLENDTVCRSVQLLRYFDEKQLNTCGHCDVCLQNKKRKTINYQPQILEALAKNNPLSSAEIIALLDANELDILIALRDLLAEEKIKSTKQQKFYRVS